MIDLIENVLRLKKENKVISIEYAICFVLSFALWGYYIIKAGIFSFTFAKKYNFRLNGLTKQDTYLGPYRVYLFK